MEKVKIEIYCYLIADTSTKVLQKCSLSSPLPNIWILSKLLNLIGCHGNQKDKFAKKYSKIISPKAIRGMKLKLHRNVHNISLYKMCDFLLPLLMCFCGYDNLNFPLTYNGKSESSLYCYLIADILTNVLKRCSLSNPLPNIWILSKLLNLIGCHGNQKYKFAKKY